MKGWICGLVIGIVVGSAVAEGAQYGPIPWQTLTSISARSEELQKGYIEGVGDALGMLVGAPRYAGDNKPFAEYLKEQGSCLKAIGSVEEILWRARALWRNNIAWGSPDSSAAILLVEAACVLKR